MGKDLKGLETTEDEKHREIDLVADALKVV